MESSSRDRSSSRMDASVASHQQVAAYQQDRRRNLKSSGKAGSGRRRRRPSGDHAPFSSPGADARMDASSACRGGSRRLDNSSAYSNNGSVGVSHRRESGSSNNNNNLLSRDRSSSGMHSSGSVMHTSGSSGMDLSTTGGVQKKHSYNQKLKAAQKLSEEEHHNHHQTTRQRPGSRRPTTSRRRCSVGANSAAAGEEGGKHQRGSRSPTHKPHKQRHLSDKYKLIGRVGGGGRRQSVDSAVTSTMDGSSNNNDAASVRSHSISPQGERRLRTRDRIIPPRNNSTDNSKKLEKSLTATRLKKAFSADEFPSTPGGGRSGTRSPARGVRRQTSLQNGHSKGPPSRRMVERKMSATESRTTNKVSRRSSLPSAPVGNSGVEDGCSDSMVRKQQEEQQQEHLKQRHPQDMASRTTLNTPKLKSKLQASMDAQAVLDTSMPSLTALDLSVHAGGKRTSDGCSVFTSNTTDTTPTMTEESITTARPTIPHPLSKAPSFSLLVDNAQSHSAIAARTTTDNSEAQEEREVAEELEEALTICDSVGDNNNKSVNGVARNNATANDHHHCLGDMNKSDPTNGGRSMTDMSRSDTSDSSQGLGHSSRLGDSRMGGSRMDGSRMASSRRRARSNDDVVPRRRRQSSRERKRSTSRGGKNMNRKVDSERNLKLRSSRSRSGERKVQRRATMSTGRTPSRDGRGNSSSSSLFKDEFGRVAGGASAPLQRSKTTASAVRQKSSKNLQRSHTMTTEPTTRPRRQKSASNLHRQKSASSIRSANSKTSTARGNSKKKIAKSMMSESLGQLETTWVRGSAEGGKELQNQASKALSQIAAEGKANKNSNISRSSTASVGSMESRSSRLSFSGRRKGPPRRSMSIGSVSLASQESAGAPNRTSRTGRATSKDDPEQRGSDATWSLADIDLDGGLSKPNNDTDPDPDSSIATPPTVSSSSAEEKTEDETPRRKREIGVRRTQSAGTNYAAADGRNRRQPSQKSLSSTAQKSLMSKASADTKRAFSVNYGANRTVDPFEMDPFQDQEKETEIQGDPFESSLHDPFTPNDPFGLSKPYQIQKLNVLGQPTKTDDGSTDDDSFHMTNDFGDFGHDESFGSVCFDENSQDFAVVPIEEATHAARSLLG